MIERITFHRSYRRYDLNSCCRLFFTISLFVFRHPNPAYRPQSNIKAFPNASLLDIEFSPQKTIYALAYSRLFQQKHKTLNSSKARLLLIRVPYWTARYISRTHQFDGRPPTISSSAWRFHSAGSAVLPAERLVGSALH